MSESKPCPLCNIPEGEVLAEFHDWRLARTKNMKGHKERLMLVHRKHLRVLDEQAVGEAYMLLLRAGEKFFSYAKQWAIFEPIYATVPDHWHRVASDLAEGSQDHDQILKTPRIVVDNRNGTISKALPLTTHLKEAVT